jgi:pyruvate kinase
MKVNKTKIVGTIGPASNSKSMITKLVKAGLNVARLNFSHGTYEGHQKVVNIIREVSEDLNTPIAILLDLQGPKIRTGKLKNGAPVNLEPGNSFKITSRNVQGTSEITSTTYKNLPSDVKKGDRILIDDGLIELKVIRKNKDTVTATVVIGGVLKENKGINLPGVNVSAPSLTPKDKKDLAFGIKIGVDYFALSFVRTAKDIEIIKKEIRKKRYEVPIIAKIEKPEAVDNLQEILKVADVIMVARGDLGVELNAEQVPVIQKYIIKESIKANRPVITATQMLETMVNNPIPTRAEASDVANAIYDGTSAIMLSAESASGKYPLKAVQMMSKIAREVEASPYMNFNIHHERTEEDPITHAVAQQAVSILCELNAKAIISFSMSGKTGKLISKQRPGCPVYVFTPSIRTYNRLALVWGVTPLIVPAVKNTQHLIDLAEKILIKKKVVKKNDVIVIMAGLALETGTTNLIKIHHIGRKD